MSKYPIILHDDVNSTAEGCKCTTPSSARVYVSFFNARTACDLTAPFEHASTIDFFAYNAMFVAPIATQQIASIHALRCCVAFTSDGAHGASLMICLTKIVGIVRVNEIMPRRRFYRQSLRHKTVSIVAGNHLGRAIKTVLEPHPDLPKRSHFHPTRFYRARTRQTMALTLQPHQTLHRLNAHGINWPK